MSCPPVGWGRGLEGVVGGSQGLSKTSYTVKYTVMQFDATKITLFFYLFHTNCIFVYYL